MQGDEIFYQYNPKCTVQFLFHLLSTTTLSVLIISCLMIGFSCKRQIQNLQEENANLKNLIVDGIESHFRRPMKNGYESD
jgi:hypothetical protein